MKRVIKCQREAKAEGSMQELQRFLAGRLYAEWIDATQSGAYIYRDIEYVKRKLFDLCDLIVEDRYDYSNELVQFVQQKPDDLKDICYDFAMRHYNDYNWES